MISVGFLHSCVMKWFLIYALALKSVTERGEDTETKALFPVCERWRPRKAPTSAEDFVCILSFLFLPTEEHKAL